MTRALKLLILYAQSYVDNGCLLLDNLMSQSLISCMLSVLIEWTHVLTILTKRLLQDHYRTVWMRLLCEKRYCNADVFVDSLDIGVIVLVFGDEYIDITLNFTLPTNRVNSDLSVEDEVLFLLVFRLLDSLRYITFLRWIPALLSQNLSIIY